MLLVKKNMLNHLISSKTRIRLLVRFFIDASRRGHLRGLATELDENTNAIRKELNNLTEAGYLIKERAGNKVEYRTNISHSFFNTLQQLVNKYVGVDQIILQVLEKMGAVTRIFLMGSYAKGIESDTISIVVEGPNLNEEYLNFLSKKLTKELNKTVLINTTVLFEEQGLLVFER